MSTSEPRSPSGPLSQTAVAPSETQPLKTRYVKPLAVPSLCCCLVFSSMGCTLCGVFTFGNACLWDMHQLCTPEHRKELLNDPNSSVMSVVTDAVRWNFVGATSAAGGSARSHTPSIEAQHIRTPSRFRSTGNSKGTACCSLDCFESWLI